MSFVKSDRVEKKSNAVLKKTFKEVVIDKSPLKVASTNKDEKWYSISDKTSKQSKGYMLTTSAIRRFDKFDFMVLFNPNKSINKVRVLIYREQHGGEIASKRWLKQFEGKTIKNTKTLNKEVDGISGATLSCNAITKEIKNSLIKIQKVN